MKRELKKLFGKARFWYESKSARERFMILGVAWILLFLWFTALSGKTRHLFGASAGLDKREELARLVISQSPKIQKKLDNCLKKFDPSRTVSSINLQIFSENCAQDADLSYSLSSITTNDAGRFKINNLTLSCSKASMASLAKFEDRLSEYEPYISVSKALFDGDSKGNASARYSISSFEFAPEEGK